MNIYPEGRVKIYDNKTSKVLVDSHNMILDGGRNFIRDVFLYQFLGKNCAKDATTIGTLVFNNESGLQHLDQSNSSNTHIPAYGACEIAFGSQTSPTIRNGNYEYLYDDTDSRKVLGLPISNDDITLKFDPTDNKLVFVLKIHSDSTNVIARELGIIIRDRVDTNYTYRVFSRICFDPLAIEPDSDLTLEYSIYF